MAIELPAFIGGPGRPPRPYSLERHGAAPAFTAPFSVTLFGEAQQDAAELPRGTVVALVGENGAGKSTLVKLLCKLYEPSGADPGRRRAAATHVRRRLAARVGGAFQDFFRFEFIARNGIGVGDVPRMTTSPR